MALSNQEKKLCKTLHTCTLVASHIIACSGVYIFNKAITSTIRYLLGSLIAMVCSSNTHPVLIAHHEHAAAATAPAHNRARCELNYL